MNETIRKFGYPATLISEWDYWVLLLRAAQPTLGSCILAAKSEATEFGSLEAAAFAELANIVPVVEQAVRDASNYARINWLMLMMVDPHVHFHVIPRYEGARRWADTDFVDHGWPGLPKLGDAVALDPTAIADLVAQIKQGCLSREH